MRRIRSIALACGIATASLCGPAVWAGVVVTPGSMYGWAFSSADDPGGRASGQFWTGPATAPLGQGSANLVVGSATSSEVFINTALASGLKLSAVNGLSYSSYVTDTTSTRAGAAPTLQFDIRLNAPGAPDDTARLVFDPGVLGSARPDTWQRWDAMNTSAWTLTRSSGNAACQLASGSYCSLAQVLALYPEISLIDVMFKGGGNLGRFNGSVDAFNFDTADSSRTFDFEPLQMQAAVPEPTSRALLALGLALAGLTMHSRRRRSRPVSRLRR